MKNFYDLKKEEIYEWLKERGYPDFRAGQIIAWKNKGIESFDEMTNISKELRKELAIFFYADGIKIYDKLVSKKDGTVKYLFKLKNGDIIESVFMKYKYGNSVCISSQSGCKMGCSFCASAKTGFAGNLSAGQMFAQVAIIAKDTGERISGVVVMGTGEPLDNYHELVEFLKQVNSPSGMNIGMRHITVSTCGLVDEMLKFSEEELQVTLSVSLHAPNDGVRMKIMPITRKYGVDTILSACRKYTERTGRRITFEYILFKDINDLPGHARELAKKLKGILCHVNLIPANEFPGCKFTASGHNDIIKFKNILSSERINVTIRRELGTDIMAACGQLRRTAKNNKKEN